MTRTFKTITKLLIRPEFYYLLRHREGNGLPPGEDMEHARAAMDWLLKANEVCGGRGFSKVYSVKRGWHGPYVETTGYIIPTLYEFSKADVYRSRDVASAIRSSLDFLIAHQYTDGAFGDSMSYRPLVYETRSPMVFDTGQVIFGLLAGHREEGHPGCLESAKRAGDWLLSMMDAEGRWVKYTFSGKARTYYSRVGHALAELWRVTGAERYREGALRHLRWVSAQQTTWGSFRNISFTSDDLVVLHVIAYTIDGLWKAGAVLGEKEFRDSALRAASALARMQAQGGALSGHFDVEWNPTDPARCLTGLAQMAEVWMLMYRDCRDPLLLKAADDAVNYLKRLQILDRSWVNIYGALPGSHPWNGRYFSWAFPNWAQKFFIDALLLHEQTHRQSD